MTEKNLKLFYLKNKVTLEKDNNQPLLFYKEATSHLEVITNPIKEYSKFSEIVVQDIVNLRILLFLNKTDENWNNWCEKIVRYVEIQYANLQSKENEASRKKADSITIYNQIVDLFIAIYVIKNDLRYFNTALKIKDLSWINPCNNDVSSCFIFNFTSQKIEFILNNLKNG